MGLIYALSLIYNLGMAYLNAVVHVRPHAKSLKPRKPSHLNLRFKEKRPGPAQAGDALPAMTMHDKHALRRRLRARRNRLTPHQQRLASRHAARHLERLLAYARARRIAAYIARKGRMIEEFDLPSRSGELPGSPLDD